MAKCNLSTSISLFYFSPFRAIVNIVLTTGNRVNLKYATTATDNPVNGGHQTVTIRASTSAAGTAPLKIASGTLLTTLEVGAIEFVTNCLYYTQTTGPTRMTVLAVDDALGASGDLYYRNGTGDLVRLPVGTTSQVLTVSSGAPTWATAGSGLSQQQVMAIATMRI